MFLGKGLRVSEDLEKYYEVRNNDIDSLLQDLRWLDQHCFENTVIRRRNLSELAETLEKFLLRLVKHREILSMLNSRKIIKAEQVKFKAIEDICVVLKIEGNKDGSIASKNAIKVVNRIYNLLESYKTTEL